MVNTYQEWMLFLMEDMKYLHQKIRITRLNLLTKTQREH